MKITDRTEAGPTFPSSHPSALTEARVDNAKPPSSKAPAGNTATSKAAGAPLQGPRTVEDVATLLGIPTTEMTPAIRKGLAQLIEDVVRLQREIEAKNQRIAYLEKLVDEDPLMPVLNRRAFVRELTRSMAYADRYGVTSSVLYFDVNGMKQINDTYGHGAGDAALSHVALTLTAHVRKSDIVGRLGGDEFGVILVQADEPVAKMKGDSLAKSIAETPFPWERRQLFVDVSFGVSSFSGPVNTPDEALAAADQHMYADKRAKRGEAL